MGLVSKPVQLFVTCLINAFYPAAGMAVVDVLEGLGLTVEFPARQTCCGQPPFNGGFWDEARPLARHTLDILAATDGPIVVPSGSCTAMMLHQYPELLAAEPEYLAKLEAISGRTYEFTQFLVDELQVADVGAVGSGRATYHSSCHGLRHLNLKSQAKTLLANVHGLKLTALRGEEECCGFGGLFAVKMSDISGAMLNRKLDNVQASGAEILVGSDISCLMHMAGGLRKRGHSIQVKYIAQLLAQAQGRPE